MKNKLMYPLVFVALWGAACGGDGARRGDQPSYETVQEGSAAGVTSTIHGPGEVMPPVTGTNADTTTAFTIDPNAVGTATTQLPPNAVPGALSTTMPPPAYPPPQMSSSPGMPQQPSRPVYLPPPAQPAPAQPQPVPREPEPEVTPPPTDTPPPTETAPPTQTDTNASPPPEQEEPEEEEPPPPPTTTDTRGQ